MSKHNSPNAALLRRIDELRRKANIPSIRQLILRANELTPEANLKDDTIRLLQRGNRPVRERLRALAKALGCELSYLEEVAADLRLDSRAGNEREWSDIFESVAPDRRDDFLESVKAFRRHFRN